MTRTEISNFYNKYKAHLFNASVRIVDDRMDAEEIMQDTIIKFLAFDEGDSMTPQQVEAWLVKTCIRASIDLLRKKKSTEAFLEEYQEDMISEEKNNDMWTSMIASSHRHKLIKKIQMCISQLPDGYRTIISLILFEGYDYEEVSQIMNIKEVTVRSQYLRAKNKLAFMINENNK